MVEREVAQRLFAREFNDSKFSIHPELYEVSHEGGHAPNFLVSPVGSKINRLFVAGVVTEIDNIGTEHDLWRARVVDPSGVFIIYAGQYQPEAAIFLSTLEIPEYVSVIGKARIYEPESGSVFISIRPEDINMIDAGTRDRWIVDTAELTLDRVDAFSKAIASDLTGTELIGHLIRNNSPQGLAEGITLALDHYHTDEGYLHKLKGVVLDCVRSIGTGSGGKDAVPYEDHVLELMKEMDMGKGIDYAELVIIAKSRGMVEGVIVAAVRKLLARGMCYEPKIGILKVVS
ncbi:MAG TPA: DNA-binding protein [Methanosarcinaceae archaeon]|nr:DNA-binding protein [Methanosarcinaceae archaeon]